MPDVDFRVFLSCSLRPEDHQVIERFKRLIQSFDINPVIYDYQEQGRLSDKVKEHIINSDCLIAIATRRKKVEGTDSWSTPDWIHHEVALAHAYRKPVAIFVEEGVKIEGLLEAEERRQEFQRADFFHNFDKLTKFLFKLRYHLESTYRVDNLNLPLLLRHYVHVREDMRSRAQTVFRCEILMESLIDNLEATHHTDELEDVTPGLSVRPQQFDFICKEIPAGKRAERVLVQDTDAKNLWRINFIPPLKKGDKVKYAFKLVQQNTRPWTLREALERIERGTYKYRDAKCEACEWSIAYPTAEFIFQMDFPEEYEIRDPYLDVRMGAAKLNADNELRRINDGNMFSAEKIIDRWSLSLRVPKPLQDHTYYIYYNPPDTD